MNFRLLKPKHMEMTMTMNNNYIKRLIFSFLAVALIAVPSTVFAAVPDGVKKDLLERVKRSILKDASGATGLKGAVMAPLLIACSPGPETLFKGPLRSAQRIPVNSPWKRI